ncbi:Glutamyl-tRNA(Gln) amidotransferase subunit A [Calidithermus terrae]|uniref:Glutamyl-tRNA(Gln) amidotransferase subunit A n=1 Tax=Calidithermus terrae TaxID=1408545 RepID=A0A399EAH4_9DEIN|nr:amidase family protein [Calidithermus terrae]RIH81724.1 Glutamyl-tRNA(Gln) amidotransferase subunit A [Calidithermus terrae]
MSQQSSPSAPAAQAGQADKPSSPKRDWESFVARQVQEQTARHEYPLRRKLDFSPFEEALARLEPSLLERLEALTQSSSIPELQAALQRGETSSEQLTLFYLGRIRRYNDRLGAYLELNPLALEQARALDLERRQGRLRGPLHGIPLSLKDNIATATPMHTTAGAAALREAVADRDAFVARRLLEAGAVILGKNNLSEWANFMTSTSVNGFSALGGHTRNPYGPFDVGGSSSGTAAAVAANLAVAGVGSETSGSLVYPAAQNSLFTLKPTLGLVSRDRIIPITDAQDTAGPLAKNAADLAVLMSVLAAHDPNDPLTQRALHPRAGEFAKAPAPLSLRGVRVGWVQHVQREGDVPVLERVARALGELGAELVPVPFPEAKIEMLPVLRYGLRQGVNAYLEATGAPVRSLEQVIAFNAHNPAAAPYGQDLLQASQAEPMSAEDYRALVEHNRRTGMATLRDLMSQNGVSLLVTVSNSLSLYTSTSGFPVLNLPAGYRDSGEPVGVSLVGDLLEDAHLISLAQAISERLNARRPPRL